MLLRPETDRLVRSISLRYQARGMRKYVGTEEDSRDLKKAKKEGKLSEAMLDRRMKLKR